MLVVHTLTGDWKFEVIIKQRFNRRCFGENLGMRNGFLVQ
jgi:hypothetical protein